MDRSYGWLTKPDEVLVVKFEDLIGANGGGSSGAQMAALTKIAEWLNATNINLSEVQNKMFGNTPTFRKGQIGAWREEFSQEAINAFSDVVGPRREPVPDSVESERWPPDFGQSVKVDIQII